MRQLTLSFFGAFEATLDGQALIHFRSSKVQGLLIILALKAEQAHNREALATFFWPDEPEATAKHNLRQSLFRLRKVLGDTEPDDTPFLLVNRATVQLNPASDIAIDTARFSIGLSEGQLESAVAIYQDELLPGFSCNSRPFDAWLRQTREQLHQQMLEALFKLTDRYLAQADYAKAQQYARQQLLLEAWREEAHRQLMQALVLTGQRSEALAQYDRCRVILAEELGTTPSAETERLITHIRETAPGPVARPSDHDPAHRPQLVIPFVGRQAEIETLIGAYQRVGYDGVQMVTVVGKAGIGKTRLTQQFSTWAVAQGADLLQGRAFETGTGLPYQPLIHLFRQRLERENAPEDLLSDLWLSQLTRLLPELRDRYPDLPLPLQDESISKQHLFEAVTRLGLALADRRPLVLIIEDWHWADSASLDLLQYAAVRWVEEGRPILLVLTLRQEGMSPETQSWLTRFIPNSAAADLRLNPLTRQQMVRLLRTLMDLSDHKAESPFSRFCDWLFNETEGLPLFLAETLKALAADRLIWQDSGGVGWQVDWARLDQQGIRQRALSGMQTAIRGWLDRISDDAQRVLTAAAVLVQDASFDHICQVSGLEELQALEALDDLLSKQFLLEAEPTLSAAGIETIYTFSHQKMSAGVYAEAGSARQRLLHRRAFNALQVNSAPAAACAYHALRAGLAAETIHYSLEAGRAAMSASATRVALFHYKTAWDVSTQKGWSAVLSSADREALFMGLGRAYQLLDEWAKAKEVYETMLAFAQEKADLNMQCQSYNQLAIVHARGLQGVPYAITLLEQARVIADRSGNRRGLVETELNLALATRMAEDVYAVIKHAGNALTMARQLEDPHLLARCLIENAYSSFPMRRWDRLEMYWNEAHQLFLRNGNPIWAEKCQAGVTWALMLNGRAAESLPILQASHAFTQQIESVWEETEVVRSLGLNHLELGNYGQALAYIERAELLSEQAPIPTIKTMSRIFWGISQRTILSLDAAKGPLINHLEEIMPVGKVNIADWFAAELCAFHALGGEWEEAHRYAKLALSLRRQMPLPPISFTGWYEIEALLRGGDHELARADVDFIASTLGKAKRYHLPLIRSQAVLAWWDGDIGGAISYLESALALSREMRLPGEVWLILGELGRLYEERGESEMGRAAYREAAEIILGLAETLDDEGLKTGFLTADLVQATLEKSKPS